MLHLHTNNKECERMTQACSIYKKDLVIRAVKLDIILTVQLIWVSRHISRYSQRDVRIILSNH